MTTPAASDLTDSQGRMLVFLSVSAFASAANLRICDSLLPQIAGEFMVTVGTAAAVVTAFSVSYGLAQIVAGPLGDARGKIVMVAAGSLFAGLMTALCATMPQLLSLVASRFLAGAGAAAVIPLAFAWVGDVVPYDKRQAVLARFLSGQIMGIVFGQAMGGILGDLAGWRMTMALVGALHLGAGAMLVAEMRRSRVGIVEAGRANWRQSAVSTLRVLQGPWVRVMLATVFLEGFAMFGAFAYIGAELHMRFGISLATAGLMLATMGIGAMTYVASAPMLVARLGQPGLVRYGSLCLAAGFLTLAVMPAAWFAVPAIGLVGLGFYMFHNTLQTNATQMAPDARGLAMSLFAFTLFLSQSVGVAAAAPVIDRFGARPVFVVSALLLVVVAVWFRARLVERLRSGA
ncbi:MAG: MFS transporter [Hyphomicrobiaceae bacterium]|nr:MFS transporter [Hyphomicrobiaceae bacterium]